MLDPVDVIFSDVARIVEEYTWLLLELVRSDCAELFSLSVAKLETCVDPVKTMFFLDYFDLSS